MKIDEILLKMKDTSELMVDLAYSALLYDNRQIAEEVLTLEDQIDEWNEKAQYLAVKRARETREIRKALVLIRLANSIENIADAALRIADVVLRDIEPHPIIKMMIDESDTAIVSGTVSKRSPLANRTLGETRLATETGMWIVALRRKNRWIYDPDENTLIKPGDILIARGPVEGRAHFVNVLKGKEEL